MHRNATLRPSLPSLAVDLYRAEVLSGFSRSTLRRAISSGELRAARAGTAVRIRVADLDAWLMKIADSDKPGVDGDKCGLVYLTVTTDDRRCSTTAIFGGGEWRQLKSMVARMNSAVAALAVANVAPQPYWLGAVSTTVNCGQIMAGGRRGNGCYVEAILDVDAELKALFGMKVEERGAGVEFWMGAVEWSAFLACWNYLNERIAELTRGGNFDEMNPFTPGTYSRD